MFEKLEELRVRYHKVQEALCSQEVLANPKEYQKYAQEQAELAQVVQRYEKYLKVSKDIEEIEDLLNEEKDEEMKALLREEREGLHKAQNKLEEELLLHLLPRDEKDKKNVIMEIRAGTGGEEAALFAADLYRMYSRYALEKGWKIEILNSHPTGLGGLREIIFSVEGKDVYRRLKYESGTHRVQRVPETETGGRIHTSAVTVAVLPEAEEIEVAINPKDIQMDVFRSSGPGGQSVNTTDSAVRLTHLPTGLVVTCQDERSQHKNRAKAMRVLRSRLLDLMEREQAQKISQERKSQVGTGDRSEKIRTYNFPQNRLTDHRIGLSLYRLEDILQGNCDLVIEPLIVDDSERKLKALAPQEAHHGQKASLS